MGLEALGARKSHTNTHTRARDEMTVPVTGQDESNSGGPGERGSGGSGDGEGQAGRERSANGDAGGRWRTEGNRLQYRRVLVEQGMKESKRFDTDDLRRLHF